MSKRSVSFNRPSEPTFLRKLKEEAGYKEGPSVDTKREKQNAPNLEDFEDTNEELPTVVVLKSGDLTAEEADEYQQQLDKEASEKPADLSARIVFKAPQKQKRLTPEDDDATTTATNSPKRIKRKQQPQNHVLSFDAEDEDN